MFHVWKECSRAMRIDGWLSSTSHFHSKSLKKRRRATVEGCGSQIRCTYGFGQNVRVTREHNDPAISLVSYSDLRVDAPWLTLSNEDYPINELEPFSVQSSVLSQSKHKKKQTYYSIFTIYLCTFFDCLIPESR